ncbi:MAG TPA: hypothetical protein VK695_01835 [Steroidobacteraceae bacterium]|jgi:hypothetical protein|nr:hypothetical protein [Steroidobacteraceae bacterium]
MGLAVTVVLALFWFAVALRAYQRGDMVMAGILALVGVVLTVYRVQLLKKRAQS